MIEVFGEILEKNYLLIFESLPFFDIYTLQMQYLGKYKCYRLGTFNS